MRSVGEYYENKNTNTSKMMVLMLVSNVFFFQMKINCEVGLVIVRNAKCAQVYHIEEAWFTIIKVTHGHLPRSLPLPTTEKISCYVLNKAHTICSIKFGIWDIQWLVFFN